MTMLEPPMAGTMLGDDWIATPVPDNISIGEGSQLASPLAFLHYRSRRPLGLSIGHDTGLYYGSTFELGPRAEVVIGDYCVIAAPIIATNCRIEIGSYCLISFDTVIADTPYAVPPRRYDDPRDDEETEDDGDPPVTISIGDGAWVAARAMLFGGARLGRGAIVGAGAVVDFEVPDYAVVAGNPACIVGWARPGE
jgi:acetyltransferase-like isoleucine patch superfamily enzyme